MSKLKYLIDGKADEQFENMLWCFGGGDPDDTGGGGGGDVSDEDLDEELQQDIAAAAVERSGGNVGNYSYAPSFNREESDNNYLVAATADLLQQADIAPQGQMQQAIDRTTRQIGTEYPVVGQAIQRAAGIPPNLVMGMNDSAGDLMLLQDEPFSSLGEPSQYNFSVGPSNLPPAVVTDLNGQAFDTTTGQLIAPLGDPYDEPQPAMVPVNSPSVPTPPPPRFQTNAQRDFFENLAGQGDAAMNQFRAEVRNLNNRGLLGSQIAAGIGNDGVPNFDTSFPAGSQIRGVTTTNFVDLPVVGTVPVSTYTGLDNPNAPADTSGDNDVVPPVANPMTGTSQCPDGYTFDEDLQACRRKTKRELQADSGTGGGSSTASGDMFYRRTSLDDAPANLPSGFNFADANRAFTQSYAFRPSFYRNPMDTTGFTKLL